VAFIVALENIFPPIPSEVVLPLAGFVAARGDATLPGMIVAATVGSLVGAWALYGIAWAFGPERLRGLVSRHGRWFGVKLSDLDRAEAWFDRRAALAVLIGRCVPLVRSLVSIPAGLRRMPLGRFSLYTVLGSLAWNTALVGAGYALKESWDDVEPVIDVVQYAVMAVLVGALAWFVWRRKLRRPVSPEAKPETR
jgi:membrane protein DedA with SNARE-associated domain